MLVSDSEIALGDTTDAWLATGLAERTTSAQLAAREKGYLKAQDLSGMQMTAARRIARRHGLLDDKGQPTESGTSLCVGLWQQWEAYVSAVQEGSVVWSQLDAAPRPPTVEAVASPPLPASVLRSSWPHPAPSTGIEEALQSLDAMPGHTSEANGVGWRFRDLPLLYRNWIEEEWERTLVHAPQGQLPALDPHTADVLWVRSIFVSVDLQHDDGSGGGVEFSVPAF
jgi:hypothetical protein